MTPEVLSAAADEVRAKLHDFYKIELDAAGAEAEQFFLLALSSLDQAQRFLTLASYKQSQAIASFGR